MKEENKNNCSETVSPMPTPPKKEERKDKF